MRLWLEDIFDVRNYVGEKKLNDNIISNIKREIDLIMFLLRDYMKYKGNEIDVDEFLKRFSNIKSNSSIKNNEVYNINKMKKFIDGNEKLFVDNIINFENILSSYNEFSVNRKDRDKLKKYFNEKMRKFSLSM